MFFLADAMYRTADRSQKFELEYEELVNNKNDSMRPCLRNFITATSVPVFLALGEEEDQLADGSFKPRANDITMMRIAPVDDYIGVGDMVRFASHVLIAYAQVGTSHLSPSLSLFLSNENSALSRTTLDMFT